MLALIAALLVLASVASAGKAKSSSVALKSPARNFYPDVQAAMVRCKGDLDCCSKFSDKFRARADKNYQALLTEESIRNFLLLGEQLQSCTNSTKDDSDDFRKCVREVGETAIRRTRQVETRRIQANARAASRLCPKDKKKGYKKDGKKGGKKGSKKSYNNDSTNGGSDSIRISGGERSRNVARNARGKMSYKTCSYAIKYSVNAQKRRLRAVMFSNLELLYSIRRHADLRAELSFLSMGRRASECPDRDCWRDVLSQCPKTPSKALRRCRYYITRMPYYPSGAQADDARNKVRDAVSKCKTGRAGSRCRAAAINAARSEVESELRTSFRLSRALAMRRSFLDLKKCKGESACVKKVFKTAAEQQWHDSEIIASLNARTLKRDCRDFKTKKGKKSKAYKCRKAVDKQLAKELYKLRKYLLSKEYLEKFIKNGANSVLFGLNFGSPTQQPKSSKKVVDDDLIDLSFDGDGKKLKEVKKSKTTKKATTTTKKATTAPAGVMAVVQEIMRADNGALAGFVTDDAVSYACRNYNSKIRRLNARLERLIRRSRACASDNTRCVETATALINSVRARIESITDRCALF